jgi:hypothetical protein
MLLLLPTLWIVMISDAMISVTPTRMRMGPTIPAKCPGSFTIGAYA